MIATHREQLLTNDGVASLLEEVAGLLERQGANPFRIRAYRRAAVTVRQLPGPLAEILQQQGTAGLMELEGIGRSLAQTIERLMRTGRLPLLERLRGDDVAERLFTTVPDIGPELARRIHEELGIETLSELEAAARDGRLGRIAGMGGKRIRAVRECLAGRFLRPATAARTAPSQVDWPATSETVVVAELLALDARYRQLAERDRLPRIAPRRFNPTRQAWLPVWHTRQGGRHYTVLFSNTARAHELGTTHDWVLIYRDDPQDQGHWTVITAQYGQLRGRRIVRGREAECQAYYAEQQQQAT